MGAIQTKYKNIKLLYELRKKYTGKYMSFVQTHVRACYPHIFFSFHNANTYNDYTTFLNRSADDLDMKLYNIKIIMLYNSLSKICHIKIAPRHMI